MALNVVNTNNLFYNAIQSIDQFVEEGFSCSCCDDEPHLSYAIRKFSFYLPACLFFTACYITQFILSGLQLPNSKHFKVLDAHKQLDVRQRLGAFIHASINTIGIIGTFFISWNFIWTNPVFGATPKSFILFAHSCGYFIYDCSVELLLKPSNKWRKDILLHHFIYGVSTFVIFMSCASVYMAMLGTLVVFTDAVNHATFLNFIFELNIEKILLPLKEFSLLLRLILPSIPLTILAYDLFITGNIFRLHEKGRGVLAILFTLTMGLVTVGFGCLWHPKKRKPQIQSNNHTNGHSENANH
jgi:hypothetical protein